MNKSVPLATLVVVALIQAGCPSPTLLTNSLTVHNQLNVPITFLSVNLWPGEAGINVLGEDLAPGASFTVEKLKDGTYNICIRYGSESSKLVRQSLEGGRHYDWYVSPDKSSVSVESQCPIRRVFEFIVGFCGDCFATCRQATTPRS